MLPLFALVAAISSLVAVNGAVVQRDGTFPTSPFHGAPSTTTTSMQTSTSPVAPPSTVTTSTSPHTTTSSSATAVVTPTTTSTTPCPTSCVPVVTSCVKCTPSITTTPSTPVTSTTAPTSGADCNGIQKWQASFAYTAGNQVIFNNRLFTARQWTFNNEPPTHPDQWTAGGTCGQPINNKASCAGIAAWQSNVAYTAGKQVTFDNHLWSAVQWTQSNAPGDASGSWKDLGACA